MRIDREKLIEEMARAICIACHNDPDMHATALDEATRRLFQVEGRLVWMEYIPDTKAALAVIESILAASEEMREALDRLQSKNDPVWRYHAKYKGEEDAEFADKALAAFDTVTATQPGADEEE